MADPFIGEIRLFGFNFPPAGWALCDGAILSVSQNQPLYTLLGNLYGGNAPSTFALPDLRGRVPIHRSNTIIQGSSGGIEKITLNATEIPSHTHTVRASSTSANQTGPQNNTWASGTGYSKLTPDVRMGTSAIAPNQGSAAHENRQPYLVINFCISLVGFFPARN
jgi:microcystin-dependent protein